MADATIDLGNVVGPSGDGIESVSLAFDEATRTLGFEAERTSGGDPVTGDVILPQSLICAHVNAGETAETVAASFSPDLHRAVLDIDTLNLWRSVAGQGGGGRTWELAARLQRRWTQRQDRNADVTPKSGWSVAESLKWHIFPGGAFLLFGALTHTAALAANSETEAATVATPAGCTIDSLCAGPATAMNWFLLKGDGGLVFRCAKASDANSSEVIRVMGVFSNWNY